MPKAFVAVVLLSIPLVLFSLLLLQSLRTLKNPPAPVTTSAPSPTEQTNPFIDHQAGFVIFTNGTGRVFTDPKYHNQSEDVYLEAGNPNVIRVKKAGTTYKDFFSTLPMKVEKDCLTTGTGQVFCNSETHSLKFFLNSQNEIDLLDREIKDNDQLLISYGPVNEDVSYQLQKIPQP